MGRGVENESEEWGRGVENESEGWGRGVENESEGWGGEWRMRSRVGEGSGE